MMTNVIRTGNNVLTAQCGIHRVAMYQKPVRVPGVDIPVQVWTCPTCEAMKILAAEKKNDGSN